MVGQLFRWNHVSRIPAEAGVDSVDHFTRRQNSSSSLSATTCPWRATAIISSRERWFWEMQIAAVGVIRVAMVSSIHHNAVVFWLEYGIARGPCQCQKSKGSVDRQYSRRANNRTFR